MEEDRNRANDETFMMNKILFDANAEIEWSLNSMNKASNYFVLSHNFERCQPLAIGSHFRSYVDSRVVVSSNKNDHGWSSEKQK
jgi:hypothetical protein